MDAINLKVESSARRIHFSYAALSITADAIRSGWDGFGYGVYGAQITRFFNDGVRAYLHALGNSVCTDA